MDSVVLTFGCFRMAALQAAFDAPIPLVRTPAVRPKGRGDDPDTEQEGHAFPRAPASKRRVTAGSDDRPSSQQADAPSAKPHRGSNANKAATADGNGNAGGGVPEVEVVSSDEGRGGGKQKPIEQSASSASKPAPAGTTQSVPPVCSALLRMVRAAQSSILVFPAGTVAKPAPERQTRKIDGKAAANGSGAEAAASPAAAGASSRSQNAGGSVGPTTPGTPAGHTGGDGVGAGHDPSDQEQGDDRGDDRVGGASSDVEVLVLDDPPDGSLSVGLSILLFFITRLVTRSRDPDEAGGPKERETFRAVRPFPLRGPSWAGLQRAGRSCAAVPLLRDEQMAR